MKALYMAVATALLISLSSCAGWFSDVIPSDRIISDDFYVEPYDAIEVESGFNIEISPYDRGLYDPKFVTIEANQNLLQYINMYVEDRTLHLELADGITIDPLSDKTYIRIYVSPLDLEYLSLKEGAYATTKEKTRFRATTLDLEVEDGSCFYGSLATGELNVYASSGSTVDVEGEFDDLYVTLDGGSEAVFYGDFCDELEARMRNGSKLYAFNLRCNSAAMWMESGSFAEVYVKNRIYATNLSGGSSLRYLGNPYITTGNITDGSTIVDAN